MPSVATRRACCSLSSSPSPAPWASSRRTRSFGSWSVPSTWSSWARFRPSMRAASSSETVSASGASAPAAPGAAPSGPWSAASQARQTASICVGASARFSGVLVLFARSHARVHSEPPAHRLGGGGAGRVQEREVSRPLPCPRGHQHTGLPAGPGAGVWSRLSWPRRECPQGQMCGPVRHPCHRRLGGWREDSTRSAPPSPLRGDETCTPRRLRFCCC